MAKIKLTKGELKKENDALRQYNRYLPTLQLKKQQLQIEILRLAVISEDKKLQEAAKTHEAGQWAALLSDTTADVKPWTAPTGIRAGTRNIAGVDIPVFDHAEFSAPEYDLFETPFWMDAAIDALRAIASLRAETQVLAGALAVLKKELRVTTQRVNLFEKVKIPEAENAIRVIKIYIGDQMASAVGRSKMAKRKIEHAKLEGVMA